MTGIFSVCCLNVLAAPFFLGTSFKTFVSKDLAKINFFSISLIGFSTAKKEMEKANSSKWKSGSNSVALRYGLRFVSLGQGERRDSCGRRRGPPSRFTANDWTTM